MHLVGLRRLSIKMQVRNVKNMMSQTISGNPQYFLCSNQSIGNGLARAFHVILSGWLPSRMVSTISGAKSVRRRTLAVYESLSPSRSGAGATLVEDGNAETQGDALYIQDGTDAGKQFAYNGTGWVLQGSASSTEIGYLQTFMGKSGNGSETPDYASTNVVTDGDSLEKGISDLDAEVGAGVATAQSRTVGPISDQAINLNVEALDDAIGADVTSTNQATAGDSVNENITALDSAIGNDVAGASARTVGAISVQDANANIEALDDAVGADVTSTKIAATTNSVNANISALDDVLGDAKTESKTDSVTTATTLDSVLVDGILAAEWLVHARSTVSGANIWAGKVLAIHDGTSTGDATTVDYNTFSILKTGSAIPALDFEVVLSGAGVSQEMQIKATSSQSVNIRISRSLLNEQ